MLMKSKVCGHCWVEAPNNKEGAQVGEAARLIENERARLGRPGWPRPTLQTNKVLGPRARLIGLGSPPREERPGSEVASSSSARSRRVDVMKREFHLYATAEFGEAGGKPRQRDRLRSLWHRGAED